MGGIGQPEKNFCQTLNNFYTNDSDENPYLNCTMSSYTDLIHISNDPIFHNKPVILSSNVQSLNSKFCELKSFIIELESKNICIADIEMQEIWQVKHPDLLSLPNFNLILNQ
jgi:hypothetical protein